MSYLEPQEPGHDCFGGVTTTAVVNYCASPPQQTRPIGDGVITKVACSRLSDSGGDAKEKGTRKVGGAVSSRFIFVFALSQFSGPDYLGAWNRLSHFQRGVRNLVCSLPIVKVLKIMKENRIVAVSDK